MKPTQEKVGMGTNVAEGTRHKAQGASEETRAGWTGGGEPLEPRELCAARVREWFEQDLLQPLRHEQPGCVVVFRDGQTLSPGGAF